MAAKEALDYFNEFNVIRAVGVEDFSDRMNSLFTTALIFVCVLIISAKQYVLTSIICYISSSVSPPGIENFVTNWCWVHGTIPLDSNNTLFEPTALNNLDKTHRIVYYQWVPIVLCLQAVLFFLPRFLWSSLCRNMTGVDTENIVVLAYEASHSNCAERRKLIATICGTLELILYDRRRRSHSWFRKIFYRISAWSVGGASSVDEDVSMERIGSMIRIKYIGLKIFYLLNIVGQLILIQHFLGFSDLSFGWKVFHSLLSGEDWTQTNWFPRVTFCNVNGILVLGGEHNYVAQCALPLNMLNEKIYIFLWFWFVLLLVCTFISLLMWLARIFNQSNQDYFIRKMLQIIEREEKTEKTIVDEYKEKQKEEENLLKETSNTVRIDKNVWHLFAHRYLRSDGIFLLRIIYYNVGESIVRDIIHNLWKIYVDKKIAEHDEQRYKNHMTIRLGHPMPLNRKKGSVDGTQPPNNGSVVYGTPENESYGTDPTAPSLQNVTRNGDSDLHAVSV